MNPIRMMIVDEHDMVRRALHILLSTTQDFNIVAEVSRLNTAVEICRVHHADMILLEPFDRYEDTILAESRIHALVDVAPVLVLSTYTELPYIQSAVRAGVCGYLGKNVTSATLIDAIRKTAHGERVFPPHFLATNKR